MIFWKALMEGRLRISIIYLYIMNYILFLTK